MDSMGECLGEVHRGFGESDRCEEREVGGRERRKIPSSWEYRRWRYPAGPSPGLCLTELPGESVSFL